MNVFNGNAGLLGPLRLDWDRFVAALEEMAVQSVARIEVLRGNPVPGTIETSPCNINVINRQDCEGARIPALTPILEKASLSALRVYIDFPQLG